MSLPDGVETYVAQGISNFGDVGRYYFHHPANMEILLRCAGLKTISNEVPKNPIVKGHRVITGVK
jgi:hypothetical protein